jgi:hypothetical protein
LYWLWFSFEMQLSLTIFSWLLHSSIPLNLHHYLLFISYNWQSFQHFLPFLTNHPLKKKLTYFLLQQQQQYRVFSYLLWIKLIHHSKWSCQSIFFRISCIQILRYENVWQRSQFQDTLISEDCYRSSVPWCLWFITLCIWTELLQNLVSCKKLFDRLPYECQAF